MSEYRLVLGAVSAYLESGNPVVCDKLLAIPDPALKRDAAVRLRLNDGLCHFFDVDTGHYPAGLTHRLVYRLEKRGHTVVVSGREPPVQFAPTESDYLVGLDMRDYQVAAIDAALGHGRGLLWMATNSGKSAVIAALCGRIVREARLRCLVIVPNAYLLTQTSKDISKLLGPDVRVGVAGDGERRLRCDVLVGTYQTLISGCPRGRMAAEDAEIAAWISAAGAVVVDETHHAGSDAYQRILTAAESARFRFGCTGSLDKSDKREESERKEGSDDSARMHRWKVEKLIGPLLYKVDNAYLIEQGFSAVPRFFIIRDRAAFGPIVRTPRSFHRGKQQNVYNKVFDLACVQDRRWHRSVAATVAHLLSLGRAPFVFSHSVKLLAGLAAALDAIGVENHVLHGDHITDERRRVVRDFEERGDFAILASSIFDEGASIPAIRAVVFAGARKSPVELLQRIGRGVRRKDGDNSVIVVDYDPVHSVMLHDHFEARLATYRDQGFKVRYVDDITQIAQSIV